MKCPMCENTTYQSLGGKHICPDCGYNSDSYRPPQKVTLIPDTLEYSAYRESGHAVMSYLIRKGFTDKYVPIDQSLILPAFERVAIESESANWAQLTFGLGSLVAVSQVLLAGYAAQRIRLNLHEAISLRHAPLIESAWHFLGGYLEEYSETDPSVRDQRATEWLAEMFTYVESTLRAHWVSVEALVAALLRFKSLSEAQAVEIIEKDIPEKHR
jgi:hypothetical protein